MVFQDGAIVPGVWLETRIELLISSNTNLTSPRKRTPATSPATDILPGLGSGRLLRSDLRGRSFLGFIGVFWIPVSPLRRWLPETSTISSALEFWTR